MNSASRARRRSLIFSVLLHAAFVACLALMSSPEPPRLRSIPIVLFAPAPAGRDLPRVRSAIVGRNNVPRNVVPRSIVPSSVSTRPKPRAFPVPTPVPQTLTERPVLLGPEPPLILPADLPQPAPAPQFHEAPPPRVVKPAGFSSVESGKTAPARRPLTETGAFDPVAPIQGHSPDAGKPISGAFGDASVAVAASLEKKTSATVSFAAAEILSKPRPLYTDEARALRIEGEVLLEVLFRASGETRILRTIASLGHGLDQNAIAAASAIQFRPAKRGDVPVDSTAVVHIVFQLAY